MNNAAKVPLLNNHYCLMADKFIPITGFATPTEAANYRAENPEIADWKVYKYSGPAEPYQVVEFGNNIIKPEVGV